MMKQKIKFSVAIPTYKDKFLKETIDSVLSQSYQDFELIIVNDASPYDIDSVVSQFDDNRILYFKNEKNCGAKNVVDNWNICLSKSSGDFFICIGDDDKLKPNCLSDLYNLICKYPDIEVLHSQTEIIDEDSNFIQLMERRPEWESVFSLVYSISDSGLGSYLYKTETLRKNGGFYKLPYGWSSDFISTFVAAEVYGIVNTQVPGFQYRGNGMSISHDMTGIEDKIVANLKAKEWIDSFVSPKETNNERDKKFKDLILMSNNNRTNQKNDDLLEFDIRKDFYNRALFWLIRRKKYDISFVRYLRCVIKSLKYRYNHH